MYEVKQSSILLFTSDNEASKHRKLFLFWKILKKMLPYKLIVIIKFALTVSNICGDVLM